MATKPFDVSKFRKTITKSIEGLSIGFRDPDTWISTNNYALNYLISGDFQRGIPLGKVTVFAGESGAGKSFICSGNLVKNAQEQGIILQGTIWQAFGNWQGNEVSLHLIIIPLVYDIAQNANLTGTWHLNDTMQKVITDTLHLLAKLHIFLFYY